MDDPRWVLYRVRDGFKVYYTGKCAWGRADSHTANMSIERSDAKVFSDEHLERELKVWPGLKTLEMEPA